MSYLKQILILILISNSKATKYCVVRLDNESEYPDNPPIVTALDGEFVWPNGTFFDDDRSISLLSDQSWILSCSGNKFEKILNQNVEYLKARCIDEDRFNIETDEGLNLGEKIFDDLSCEEQPLDEAADSPNSSCGPDKKAQLLEIGFSGPNGELFQTLQVCFDPLRYRALYAQHILPRENIARDLYNDRPYFKADGRYPFDVNAAYSRQEDVIADLVGPDLAEEYIQRDDQLFLARGHLAPNADFVFYSHQDSSFYYINCVPQWQSINGGNWVRMENNVRSLSHDRDTDLEIYSGTSGTLMLDNADGIPVEIVLDIESRGLPVPLFIWKLVIDRADNSGVVIVSVNNPHLSNSGSEDIRMCKDEITNHVLLDDIEDKNDPKEGIIYACAVEDARAKLPEIPFVGNLDLLQ